MIRVILAVVSAAYLIAAAATYYFHLPLWLTAYLLINGLVIAVALPVERGRYRGATDRGQWEPTGERFVDPTTGRLVEVQYDRRSGKRRYRDQNLTGS